MYRTAVAPDVAPPGPASNRRSGRGDGPRDLATDETIGLNQDPGRGRHATGWDSGFDRVVSWTVLGSLLPGTGLIASGRRALGWFIFGGCLLVGLSAAGLVLLGDPVKFVSKNLLSHPERLTYAAIAVVVLGILWAVHVVVTNLSLRRFAQLTGAQSMLSWSLVLTLAAGGIGSAAITGKNTQLFVDTLNATLGGDDGSLPGTAKRPDAAKTDPWAKVDRMNVLLIGSDAGADRTGVRTDTIIVASIDTKTGETVLFSLPRNLEHVPFPRGSQQAADYPDGFYSPDHSSMLNALWQFGVEHKAQYYPKEKNPGLTATREGVEQALGIDIDTWAMVDLRGFMQFVDAIGGVTINVPRRIPVGGHRDAKTGIESGVTSYLKPGRRKLNGYQALWFARSRSDSDDFERMRRQRCVIGAVTSQADPQTIAMSLPGILRAAKDNIRTGIRLADIDAWVTLTLRVQKAHVRSLPFTNAVIASGDPDFEKMHELVQDAINEPPPAVVATPSPSVSASPSASGNKHKPRASASPSGDPEKAVDVKAVC